RKFPSSAHSTTDRAPPPAGGGTEDPTPILHSPINTSRFFSALSRVDCLIICFPLIESVPPLDFDHYRMVGLLESYACGVAAKNSRRTGANAVGTMSWDCPSRARTRPSGRAFASAFAALPMKAGLSLP